MGQCGNFSILTQAHLDCPLGTAEGSALFLKAWGLKTHPWQSFVQLMVDGSFDSLFLKYIESTETFRDAILAYNAL